MQLKEKHLYNIGIALVLLGGLGLFSNFGFFNGPGGLMGALVLSVGGGLFGRTYLRNKNHIWALIVAAAFFGAAAAAISGAIAGSYFLAILAAGFGVAYWDDRRRWWAIIPAGILVTLSTIAGFEVMFPRWDDAIAPIFFLGTALTFGTLTMLPDRAQRWAVYPSLAAIVLAILSSSFTGGWVFPILMIGGGVYLLNRRNKGNFTLPRIEIKMPERTDAEKVNVQKSDAQKPDTQKPDVEKVAIEKDDVERTVSSDVQTPTSASQDVSETEQRIREVTQDLEAAAKAVKQADDAVKGNTNTDDHNPLKAV